MLVKTTTLKGFTLKCRDGEIGSVKEFYFDDRHWAIRYLVANAGNWITGRKVLISPYSLESVNRPKEQIVVDLTKKQIEDSPPLNSDKPISRQFESSYYGYYGWPTYWTGPFMWGIYPSIVRDREQWMDPAPSDKTWDAHLRSTDDVSGYHIQAADGEIGHVDDFIIDDETWAIRYLIIDTHNWWTGKKVLVSPQWIERVSWSDSKVFVSLERETIKKSPEYTNHSLITRDYESSLHRHYDRAGYWVDEPVGTTHSR
ncbi:MAG: PRC-barrel domain-containing protein [Gemmatimonadaceae bacterium]